jgi:hypothetical protein
MMGINKKIISEIERYKNIDLYISEQFDMVEPEVAPAEEPANTEMGADNEVGEIPEPVDVETDPDVQVVDDEGNVEDTTETDTEESGTEELEITDLVTAQKDIQSKQDEYMNTMFEKLADLETKLSSMDAIFDKINNLENKIEKYRQKTPEEKLQLRSLDSYPYNQKLTDFFQDKEEEFEKTGKEYTLTTDDVENFSTSEIKNTFNKFEQNDEQQY